MKTVKLLALTFFLVSAPSWAGGDSDEFMDELPFELPNGFHIDQKISDDSSLVLRHFSGEVDNGDVVAVVKNIEAPDVEGFFL